MCINSILSIVGIIGSVIALIVLRHKKKTTTAILLIAVSSVDILSLTVMCINSFINSTFHASLGWLGQRKASLNAFLLASDAIAISDDMHTCTVENVQHYHDKRTKINRTASDQDLDVNISNVHGLPDA